MYTIWGRPNCQWCERAKDLLDDHDEYWEYVELTPDNLEEFNKQFHGKKTVPQIMGNGYYVGGYEDLHKHLNRFA